MTDLTSGATPEGPSGAGGGLPDESDLPAMQGLDSATDDPSDPEAAEQNSDIPPERRLGNIGQVNDEAASDPMPDISGSSNA